ncbi:dienelactone hydrolase-related enzyme [Rhodobacteraceae bacterium MCCB 386]|nr:dienelactone hydrolase-related enzyme [Roseitranquillus sediminis]
MYHKWLDRWDERRAQLGDAVKEVTGFAIDAHLAFPEATKEAGLGELCARADRALRDPIFFEDEDASDLELGRDGGWISFPSSVATDVEENNLVWARVTERRPSDHALVVFHHWNATSRNPQMAKFLSRRGITVVEIAMPYHFERSRPGSSHADYMLGPNLGRTIQSLRQAVLDGRKLIRGLRNDGYGEISVLGMSLGSWVAGLVVAHEPAVQKASLFLTAGSLADMVWTGRATQHIRASLEDKIDLADLRRAWAPLNLENYADRLARRGLDLQVVYAKRDTVVAPALTKQLIAKLENAGAELWVLELNCGHYSLSLPPYIIWAGWSLQRFLSRGHRAVSTCS